MTEPITTRDETAAALRRALSDDAFESIVDWLDPQVIWGQCHNRDLVMSHLGEVFTSGATILSGRVDVLDDRFIVDLVASIDGVEFPCALAMFDDAGRIVEMQGPGSIEDALAATRAGPYVASSVPAHINSLAPVFPVGDWDAAVAHYRQLGFQVESYGGGATYAYAQRGDITIHLAPVGDLDPATNMSAIYLYVSDAKALFAEWRDAGVGGRLHAPTNTEYGLCEGAHVDPDGNLLRFGSAI